MKLLGYIGCVFLALLCVEVAGLVLFVAARVVERWRAPTTRTGAGER